MKKYIQHISLGVFAALLVAGSFAYNTSTVEAKNYKHSYSYSFSGNNGLHLGWYKNGKINNVDCWGSCFQNNDFQDLLEEFRERLQKYRENRECDDNDWDNDDDLEVYTRSAQDIEDDRATLRGELDLNDEDEAEVYFVWGESRYDLDEETSHITLDDDDGNEKYGSVYSFTTDDDSDNEEYPDVETRSADDVTDDSAELGGTVDMNDFNNGTTFLVYGEDEDQVEDVEDDFDAYNEVEEDGDDLQKVRFETDLYYSESYRTEVDNLDNDTRHYFAICVSFEDEDDDDLILCGDVKSFRTDD